MGEAAGGGAAWPRPRTSSERPVLPSWQLSDGDWLAGKCPGQFPTPPTPQATWSDDVHCPEQDMGAFEQSSQASPRLWGSRGAAPQEKLSEPLGRSQPGPSTAARAQSSWELVFLSGWTRRCPHPTWLPPGAHTQLVGSWASSKGKSEKKRSGVSDWKIRFSLTRT